MRLFSLPVSLVATGALFLAAVLDPAGVPGPDLCWFRRFTGLPCPGCGLTRGCAAVLDGAFAEAWALNPFSFLFVALAILLAAGPVLARLVPWCADGQRQRRAIAIGVPVLVASLFVYGVIRLARAL